MEINFTNELNSFEHCKDIRWTLILEDYLAKKTAKNAILKKYDNLAKGCYAAKIRAELESILNSKDLKPDTVKRMVKD